MNEQETTNMDEGIEALLADDEADGETERCDGPPAAEAGRDAPPEDAGEPETEPAGGAPAGEEAEVFQLRHLSQTVEVDRARVTELAQKGLDYDRIRQQRDENEEAAAFLKRLAQQSGMTPERLIDEIQTGVYNREGLPPEKARARVAQERAERAGQVRAGQRRDEDIRAFIQAFPGVKPTEIAGEVWDGVRRGETLVSAYRSWQTRQLEQENRALKARLEADETNSRNRRKSIGSQRTGGSEAVRDAFLDALLSGDN